ncbi:HAD family hydrolase [Desulfothermobacter acidiphilus]|uniref:HAD family hydrolase n=1 Tax=Desulfothermobacter acidiphilus TaxID=1938353 RepID=UPI003F88F8B9
MLRVEIPGRGLLELNHLVLDYNGTLACDGELLPGVVERLNALGEKLTIHILTADTFGTATEKCRAIQAKLIVLRQPFTGPEKEKCVEGLGATQTVAVGNGANDVLMLRRAILGIAVLGPEGLAGELVQAADVLVRDINEALDLLLKPKRVVATLRL